MLLELKGRTELWLQCPELSGCAVHGDERNPACGKELEAMCSNDSRDFGYRSWFPRRLWDSTEHHM